MQIQIPYKSQKRGPTLAEQRLFEALISIHVPARLQVSDSKKTIDIAIPSAKVNIEVDGIHHFNDPVQAMADLYRNFHSFGKGYVTIHIPNCLALEKTVSTANLIAEFAKIHKERLKFLKWNSPSQSYLHYRARRAS